MTRRFVYPKRFKKLNVTGQKVMARGKPTISRRLAEVEACPRP